MDDNIDENGFTITVDKVEELIHDFFMCFESCDIELRHKLNALLLNCTDNMTSLGIKPHNVRKELEGTSLKSASLTIEKKNQALSNASEVAKIIWYTFEPTYLVSNYWSPLDKDRRRSIVFRRNDCEQQFPNATLYACAFYALTLYGKNHGLRSLVQYMNDVGSNRRGLFACMPGNDGNLCAMGEVSVKDCPLKGAAKNRWLCFPPLVRNEFIEKLGIPKLIDALNLKKMSSSQLEEILMDLLDGGESTQLDSDKEVIDTYFKSFDNNVNILMREEYFNNYINESVEKMNQFFGKQLSKNQVCFILATHLTWQRACCHVDTTYIYIFPTYVSGTCCVLTLGTKKKLMPIEEIGTARIAHSLFVYPLLLDYKQKERESLEIEHFESHRRLLGHNFPKILHVPALNQLQRIRNALEMYRLNNSDSVKPTPSQLQERIDILLSIFSHNESLLTATLSLESPNRFFSKKPTSLTISDIFKPLKGIEHLYREKANPVWQNIGLASALSIRSSWSNIGECSIVGHLSYLREAVINLIINSFEQIESGCIEKDPERSIVDVEASFTKDQKWLLIRVQDRAGGFTEKNRGRALETQDGLRAIKDENLFYSKLNKLIFDKIKGSTAGIHGLGILFCIAYLRALEWTEHIHRAGFVGIKNNGCGSLVELWVPFVTIIENGSSIASVWDDSETGCI